MSAQPLPEPAPRTIPAYLLADLVNAGVSDQHDYGEQLAVLETVSKAYFYLACWLTPDWDQLPDLELREQISATIREGDLGGTFRRLKERLIASGFRTPATWLLPDFFGSPTMTKPLSEIRRNQALDIDTLMQPYLTQLRVKASGNVRTNADALHFKLGKLPTPLQRAIWKALGGKALTKSRLAKACNLTDESRLYRNGGLNELRELGLVDHHRGIGYYRPDAPPNE